MLLYSFFFLYKPIKKEIVNFSETVDSTQLVAQPTSVSDEVVPNLHSDLIQTLMAANPLVRLHYRSIQFCVLVPS